MSAAPLVVDHANPIHDGFCRCRACKPPLPSSYRDILARNERRRPDGSPVWPLRPDEIGLLKPVAHPHQKGGAL